MNRDLLRQAVNVLAVVATIVVNGLANALPLNGQTTAAISDRFHVFFVPAGYVFSIWGLIYIGLVAFAIYQARPAVREHAGLRRIGYWFALGCAANIAWLFLWHYEQFPLTLVAMSVLLLSLIVIYLRLDIGRAPATTGETWCVRVPFSIYLGWITVATIANVTDVLDYLQWDGAGIAPATWAMIMLAAGVVIAVAMALTRGDAAYLLVLLWAFAGIAVKQAGMPAVATAAWTATIVVLLALAAGVLKARRAPARSG